MKFGKKALLITYIICLSLIFSACEEEAISIARSLQDTNEVMTSIVEIVTGANIKEDEVIEVSKDKDESKQSIAYEDDLIAKFDNGTDVKNEIKVEDTQKKKKTKKSPAIQKKNSSSNVQGTKPNREPVTPKEDLQLETDSDLSTDTGNPSKELVEAKDNDHANKEDDLNKSPKSITPTASISKAELVRYIQFLINNKAFINKLIDATGLKVDMVGDIKFNNGSIENMNFIFSYLIDEKHQKLMISTGYDEGSQTIVIRAKGMTLMQHKIKQ